MSGRPSGRPTGHGGPRPELVDVPTSTTPLTGLFYQPGDGDGRAVQLFHGNGMNFYTGAMRFLPPVLGERGLAALAYNRHGHDTISCSTREPEGNAYQTSAEAIADNDAARDFLAARGYRAPIAIGHSNGGMLAAHHVSRHPDTPALVLLSAHRGGADMLRLASANGLFAGDGAAEFGRHARDLVDAGEGGTLLTMPGWYYVTTAASYVDVIDNSPRLLVDAPSIACPVLFIRGALEDPELYPAETFANLAGGPVDVRIIDDCDHFYTGHEDQVATMVADWIDSVTPGRGTG